MSLNYSKKVMKNFLHPKNMGKIKNPDGFGEIGNPVCGDIIDVYIKVDKKTKKIKDIKFKTFGCVAAIASSSMLTQVIKNKTLEQAKKVTLKDVTKELGGLPPIKTHCSGMAIEALKKAIEEYENKN